MSQAERSLRFLLRSTALVGIAVFPSMATAADWTGAASSDWFTAGNWSTGVPTGADIVNINTATPNAAVVGAAAAQANSLRIGDGTLTIQSGGGVSSVIGYIGYGSGTTGTVTVTGAGSSWANSGDLDVGEQGTGTLTILNGGKVSNSDGYLGRIGGSTGIATVDGAGSSWINSGDLDIGRGGSGTLTIQNGGMVSNDYATIGGAGTVTVTGAGSSWTSDGLLTVGRDHAGTGTGTLTIQNGGAVSNDTGRIGRDSGTTGTVTVDGAGSSWTNSGTLEVGYDATGTLTIQNGGAVSNAIGHIGYEADSTGTVTVDGAGSSWTNGGGLHVGNSGTGELTIRKGGTVSDSSGYIGYNSGSTGTVTVTDAGSSWASSSHLFAGYAGTGTLTIESGGVVRNLGGYIGFQSGSTGTVTVSGAGSRWHNAADLYIGNSGSGTLTIQNGGTVKVVGAVIVALNAGSTGVLNIGAASGQAAVAPGTLDALGVTFASGTDRIVFNHTASDYTFAPGISGAGSVTVEAGTTIFTNVKSYSGPTTINGGKLVVDGLIASSTTINGGTLAGTGSVGSVTVNSGGVVAPGNSIGTLHVPGNTTFNVGSNYEVELNAAGASDLIDAVGTATISGGTVQAIAAPGQYAASTQYTILTAAGGVNGTFTGVTVNSAFLAASLDYVGDDVLLSLDRINAAMFNNAGETPNQQAAGAGLDSVAVGNTIAEKLALQSDSAKRAALDQLSGELHASIKTAGLEDSRFVREAITDRLLALPAADAPNFWIHGFGAVGTIDSDGNAAEFGRTTGGLFVGADGVIADGWRLGLLGGYSIGNHDVPGRGSSASAESYDAAIYTGFEAGGLGFKLGADYAVHSIVTDRTIAFTGFSDEDVAAYASRTAQVFGEIGYKFEAGPAWFEPYAAAAYVSHSTDGFSEAGGASALTAEADALAATFTTLGFRAATSVDLGEATGTLRGSLGWRHALGDTTPTSTVAFSGGELFTVAGVPWAADAAVVDLGFDIALPGGATFGASYSGVISEGGYDYGAKAELAWQF
ncbi:autotransporter domain-containing protein [Devosia sp. Root105]|uniref:autotransporter outer membrane beta-barrel domain-containing protein n=1 Tax=Devosia sp. Root105 TaxID=1736423 RepID=UPI0006FCF8EB|nr:autotransporter domain-containing protein [Devosia sp. Root105]KQV09501.1 hypothetical protein ASC68_04190 [Devosia sp. Root105]